MFIGGNFTAMSAHRNWTLHNNNIAKALGRLSSGKRINGASDDPAGLAVSEKMKAQLRILDSNKMNVTNGMSAIQTADSNLGVIGNMLNRMLELADQASNGTYTETERQSMDSEYQQLLDEINRMGASTTFNSMTLFKSQEAEGASSSSGIMGETITFQGNNLELYLDGIDDLLTNISLAAKEGDNEALLALGIDRTNGKTDAENLRTAVIEYTKANAETLLNTSDPDRESKGNSFEISISGGNIVIDMPEIDHEKLGLAGTNLLTQEDAKEAADALKDAIKSVAAQRGSLGAAYNRLEHTMNSLSNMEVNLTDSLSRITDADMAKEMMILVKEQLLAQTSMFAMTQMKQQPEQVLALLKSL